MISGSGTWRLGHRPALDGLRGVAVLLVILGHCAVPWAPQAGNVGVTVFFTLSGFLITALLLEERETVGRVDFRAFYARRARRLLPALSVLLLVVGLIGLAVPGYVSWSLMAGALGFVSNWVLIADYHAWGPLNHTWSLAVEEQFYLIWPALMRLRRSALRWVLAASLVVPIILRSALSSDGFFAYAATVCRPDSIALGCGLAFLVRHWSLPRALVAPGAVLIAGFAWQSSVSADLVVAPLVVALGAAAVIAGSLDGSRLLDAGPLRYIGRRSYAIYLWHYPVAAWFVRHGHARWEVRLTVVMVSSILAAELSWRVVEKRFVQRRITRLRDGLPSVHPTGRT